MKNYYTTLGVPENASATDIKRAYRALAVRYHPDKNPSPEATIRFTEITEAYDVLGDPKKKFVYDHQWYKFVHELVKEEPVKHRDPRYRPKAKAARKPQKPSHFVLMEKWNRYAYWINIVGVIIVFFFAADYFLPYAVTDEMIRKYEPVRERKGTVAYYRMHTMSGAEVKVYEKIGDVGENIVLSVTRFYRIPMEVEYPTSSSVVSLGFMYKHLVFFPALLLVIAAMGIFSRRNAEQAFSYCIGTVILMIVTLVLIY